MSTKHDGKVLERRGLAKPLSGWHPEDVKAEVRKKGVTLTELALRHDYSEAYLRNALVRPLYRGEQIIAEFLDVPAEQIWPDRYDIDGNPDYAKYRRLREQRARRAA